MLVQIYCKDKDLINQIEKLKDIHDKYGNKEFENKSELYIKLLRIGLYHYYKENKIEEKPYFTK